jgi:hypothetical protein
MSDCSWLSDRMPAVALGRAEWTTDEARHLSGCRSCQDEWELVRTASRLGEAAGLPADAFTTSRAVLHRLSQGREERLRRRAWSFAGLAAAATLVAVIWTERPLSQPGVLPLQVVTGLRIALPELDGLQPVELDSVLQTMEEPLVDGPTTLEDPTLGDLDSTELQSVLDYLEG